MNDDPGNCDSACPGNSQGYGLFGSTYVIDGIDRGSDYQCVASGHAGPGDDPELHSETGVCGDRIDGGRGMDVAGAYRLYAAPVSEYSSVDRLIAYTQKREIQTLAAIKPNHSIAGLSLKGK